MGLKKTHHTALMRYLLPGPSIATLNRRDFYVFSSNPCCPEEVVHVHTHPHTYTHCFLTHPILGLLHILYFNEHIVQLFWRTCNELDTKSILVNGQSLSLGEESP